VGGNCLQIRAAAIKSCAPLPFSDLGIAAKGHAGFLSKVYSNEILYKPHFVADRAIICVF